MPLHDICTKTFLLHLIPLPVSCTVTGSMPLTAETKDLLPLPSYPVPKLTDMEYSKEILLLSRNARESNDGFALGRCGALGDKWRSEYRGLYLHPYDLQELIHELGEIDILKHNIDSRSLGSPSLTGKALACYVLNIVTKVFAQLRLSL
ncbi:hypothetical protein QX201_001363 [Fusarium graminearum]